MQGGHPPAFIPIMAFTATSREGRTGFNRLLRHCKQGKIDRVICKSISRFARNTQDFLVALRTLKENNVHNPV